MPYIKLEDFSGIAPRIAPTLLAPNQAQVAKNVRVTSGDLRSWKKETVEYVPLTPNTQTIYKLYNEGSGAYRWLTWAHDVDAVKAPIYDDLDYRVYFTGQGEPKKTNWSLATSNGAGSGPFPNASLSLKVPPPIEAPTAVSSGGSGTTETRAYVYTYISTFGAVSEESAPSPAVSVDTYITGATVTVDGMSWNATYSKTGTTITVTQTLHKLSDRDTVYISFTSGTAASGWYTVTVTGADTFTVTTPTSSSTSGNAVILVKTSEGTFNITHRRIYRTVVGASQVSYQFVEEIPITTTSYTDNKTVVQLGSLLRTQNWNPPPDDLRGLVSMPNGMLAAFRNNEIWFSEPYHPHAWPDLYTLVVGDRIVGLGVFDTTLVVLTENHPYLITGSSPLAMSQQKLPMIQPCASKRSIAYDQYGVLYASPNGLVSISPAGADVISLPLYAREEWQALIPESMVGMIYNNQYFGFHNKAETVEAIVLSRADTPPLIEFSFDGVAAFVDKVTSNIFAVSRFDNTIYQLDSSSINRTIYEWRSKKFMMPSPLNFGAMKMRAQYSDIGDIDAYNNLLQQVIARNEALWASSSNNLLGVMNSVTFNSIVLGGSILEPIPEQGDDKYVSVFVYADGDLFYTGQFSNEEPIRLPHGERKATTWEIGLSGNIPVTTFIIATSVEELKRVPE